MEAPAEMKSGQSSDCCNSHHSNKGTKTQMSTDLMSRTRLTANDCYRNNHKPYLTLLNQWQSYVSKESRMDSKRNKIYLERIANLQKVSGEQANEIDRLKILLIEKQTELSECKRKYQNQNSASKSVSTSSSSSSALSLASLNVNLSRCYSSSNSASSSCASSLLFETELNQFLHPASVGTLKHGSIPTSTDSQSQSQSQLPLVSTPNGSENFENGSRTKRCGLESLSTIHPIHSETHGCFLGEHISLSPLEHAKDSSNGSNNNNANNNNNCLSRLIPTPIPIMSPSRSSSHPEGPTISSEVRTSMPKSAQDPIQLETQRAFPVDGEIPLLFPTHTSNANYNDCEPFDDFVLVESSEPESVPSKESQDLPDRQMQICAGSVVKSDCSLIPLRPCNNHNEKAYCQKNCQADLDFESLLNQTTASFLSAYPKRSLTWIVYKTAEKTTEEPNDLQVQTRIEAQGENQEGEIRVPVKRYDSAFKIVSIRIEGVKKRQTYYKNFVARIRKEAMTPSGRRLYQIEYYRRKVERISGILTDVFITAPRRQGYICDEEDVVCDLPEPTKARRGKFMFNFNFGPYDIPENE